MVYEKNGLSNLEETNEETIKEMNQNHQTNINIS